jgi:agmatinase
VSARHSDLVVLHIDAHTDAYDFPGLDTSTSFTRAAEERLVDTTRSFHIGTRGTASVPNAIGYARSLGYNVITMDELRADTDRYVSLVKQTVGSKPVYLCFDMDVFDPSCAPGVCTPEWGGLTPTDGLRLLRALAGINFVAFDINAVSPPHDIGGMTSFLAARVVREFCALTVEAMIAYPPLVRPPTDMQST